LRCLLVKFLCNGVFAAVLGLLLASTASAQLERRLYLEKDKYVVGEPIYLHFELTNNNTEPMQVMTGSRYSFCDGYQVQVSPDLSAHSSCVSGGVGSCLGGTTIIKPGETWKDELLLNYEHDLSKAGMYDISASRTLRYDRPDVRMSANSGIEVKSEGLFHIRLEEGSAESLAAIFEPYVADLNAKDEERMREAARAIGSLAPRFLEDTILSMMDSPATRQFAVIGLRHLNTDRAREALAKFVKSTSYYSYDREQAIKDLSEMGDKKYFPLLLDEAKNHEPNEARDYALAAARIGGEDAMPYVASLLSSPNPFTRANGVMALPETGSRRAVPILIELLRNSEMAVARLASIGLVRLTHRNPLTDNRWYSDDPANEYQVWADWWMARGADAAIYGSGECDDIEPLK